MNTKSIILSRIIQSGDKVLELGCGSKKNIRPYLDRIDYDGVDPYFDGALKDIPDKTYDVVFSLSVLEHVKYPRELIGRAAKRLRPGGLMVHCYDLGHALYPNTLKERFHVWLGNNCPGILPDSRFVCYLDSDEVIGIMEQNGVNVYNVTYHNLIGHKRFTNFVGKAAGGLFEWEFNNQKAISKIPKKQREKLFPAVCVWGRK